MILPSDRCALAREPGRFREGGRSDEKKCDHPGTQEREREEDKKRASANISGLKTISLREYAMRTGADLLSPNEGDLPEVLCNGGKHRVDCGPRNMALDEG